MQPEDLDNEEKKGGVEYETLRVRAELKARILQIQNDYFNAPATKGKKITVSRLIDEALDAREGGLGQKPEAVVKGGDPVQAALKVLLPRLKASARETIAGIVKDHLSVQSAKQEAAPRGKKTTKKTAVTSPGHARKAVNE